MTVNNMDNKQIRLANLKLLIADHKTKQALATKVGTNRSYLSQITMGIKSVGDDLARMLEQGCGKHYGWMDVFHPPSTSDVGSAGPLTPIPLIAWDLLKRVPLGNPKRTGAWATILKKNPPEAWVQTDAIIEGHAFALRVQGDAMIAPHGFPTYPIGARIVVDSHRKAISGDRVVVLIAKDGECILRQYIPEGKRKYLVALDPSHPRRVMSEKDVIVGVVVQTIIDG